MLTWMPNNKLEIEKKNYGVFQDAKYLCINLKEEWKRERSGGSLSSISVVISISSFIPFDLKKCE